jgi:hypothetical protein
MRHLRHICDAVDTSETVGIYVTPLTYLWRPRHICDDLDISVTHQTCLWRLWNICDTMDTCDTVDIYVTPYTYLWLFSTYLWHLRHFWRHEHICDAVDTSVTLLIYICDAIDISVTFLNLSVTPQTSVTSWTHLWRCGHICDTVDICVTELTHLWRYRHICDAVEISVTPWKYLLRRWHISETTTALFCMYCRCFIVTTLPASSLHNLPGRWIKFDEKRAKYWETSLFEYHFFHHKASSWCTKCMKLLEVTVFKLY